jgi:hypothetical protein
VLKRSIIQADKKKFHVFLGHQNQMSQKKFHQFVKNIFEKNTVTKFSVFWKKNRQESPKLPRI